MTPERWRRAQEVFLAATEREPALRAAFLDGKCRGDAELRKEVESLLSSYGAAPSGFLESPAIEGVPALPAAEGAVRVVGKGTSLGPYEILSPLGSGGMGDVYRARDGRLGREVAIKVLSPELSQDASRVKRFEKEARSASALNHPNIVTVYDVGSSDGLSYIAMEKVDGDTLRRLVSGGPMPIKKMLPIGAQIADGLARAHEAGIVHRDLKPENVMVTRDGLVKILDFGLAKLTSTGSSSDEGSKLPTMSGTSPGVIMGTVGYMSPEQASGSVVDYRSDQFSFGSILYELVTGKRAFSGKTPIDVLGAILNEEPQSIASINPRTPTQLRWITERCLSKEPRQRYSSTDDLARDLATLRDHLSEATSGAAPATSKRRRLARPALLGAVALLLAAVAAFQLNGGSKPPSREITLRQITSNSVENPVSASSISPDGKFLLFKDRKGVHVELIETSEVQTVAEPEATRSRGLIWDLGPWFPSSARFLMNAHVPDADNPISTGSSIWAASVLGGPAQKLREDGIAWAISPAGSEIAFGTNQGPFGDREIWLMDPAGDRPRKLFETGADGGAFALSWFDQGRQVAYIQRNKDGDSAMRRDLEGGPAITIFPPSEWKQYNDLTWLPDGRLIYGVPEPNGLHETNYWVRRLDPHTGRPVGGTKRLTNFSGSGMYSSSATADGTRVAFVKQMLHFTG